VSAEYVLEDSDLIVHSLENLKCNVIWLFIDFEFKSFIIYDLIIILDGLHLSFFTDSYHWASEQCAATAGSCIC
jgi:hypothetical protein